MAGLFGINRRAIAMAFEAEALIDRRRLKRRLLAWRVFGVAAAVVATILAFGRFEVGGGFGAHIARLSVTGVIFDDATRDKALKAVIDDNATKALIVSIDSPGGTFVGGESLYHNLRRVAESKPVVAVMRGTGASAAYMAAVATDHIIARAGTITGSIGVIMQTADITALLDRLGIKPEVIKSGRFKAQPNLLEPFLPAARAVTEEMITDLFNMFVEIVAERRGMSEAKIRELADGRVYSGRRAKELGLVDAIGAEKEALAWLIETRNIEADLPVHDVKIDGEAETWLKLLNRSLAGIFGNSIGKALLSERVGLDGVISLWQPGRTR